MEATEAAKDVAAKTGGAAFNMLICKTSTAGSFTFHIQTDNPVVGIAMAAGVLCAGVGVGVAALRLAEYYYGGEKNKRETRDAFGRAFGGDRPDRDVGDINRGSLLVDLHCYTAESFLEFLADYESGKVKERLKEELLKIGIDVEHLTIKITNLEEAEEHRKNLTSVNTTQRRVRRKQSCSIRMGWTAAQRQRLAVEKVTLEKYFAERVTWIDPTGDTKVEVELNTNSGKKYRLRIYLRNEDSDSSDFPNSVPDMVVSSSPQPMPRWGVDGDNHTIGYRDGFLKIFHHHPSKWTGLSPLFKVVMKGRIWLEAYEGHLTTKKNITFFLGEMQRPKLKPGLDSECISTIQVMQEVYKDMLFCVESL